MSLITSPNVDCRKVFKYRMKKKRHFESKKCQGKPPEPSTFSESIDKRDNGYLCLLCDSVIKHKNIKQIIEKGIRNYVKKNLIGPCLLVMYAIKDSNLNLRWLGMLKLIPEVHSLAKLLAKFEEDISLSSMQFSYLFIYLFIETFLQLFLRFISYSL